jgi:hypothetical protein
MEPMTPTKPMEPMKPMESMKARAPWWPANLGSPSSSGSQNSTRYAYFADAHRLVVDNGASIVTYDTGDHSISGFGQQQSGTSEMTFQSDHGLVGLHSLRKV